MGRKMMKDGYVGRNSAQVLETLDRSQEKLAVKLQVEGLDASRSTVSNMENGYRNIFAHELPMICRALGCRYEDLLGPVRRSEESGE